MARVLIVGCGSIGSRRARLLAEMGHEVALFDVRSFADPKDDYEWLAVRIDRDGDLALDKLSGMDAAFVCAPAATHVEIARQCIEAGVATFIEKPLALTMDGIPELVAEAERWGVVTMGACNMRWAYRELFDGPVPYSATFEVRKPLSAWRVGAEEAYRRNGIVLEAAIHEMTVAHQRFGEIHDMAIFGDGDVVSIGLTCERGMVAIYAAWGEGETTVREVTATYAGFLPPLVFWADTSDEMYRLEMQHFLDCVTEGKETCNPLRSAAHVLEWAIKAQEEIRTVAA